MNWVDIWSFRFLVLSRRCLIFRVTIMGYTIRKVKGTISAFNFFSENTPVEYVTSFTTFYNQIVMLSTFIGPMMGSQLAETSLSLTAVLWIGAALRLISGAAVGFDVPNWRGRFKRRPAPA